MDELPRKQLKSIIASYGIALHENPKRCEALLRDFCGQYRQEISLLINAQKEKVPSELLNSKNSSLPISLTITRLSKRLEDNLAITSEAAKWSVESWALAMGVSCQLPESEDETESLQQKSVENEEYESKLHQYEQEFSTAIKTEYPLTAKVRKKLSEFQQSLGIKLIDAEQIEKPILLKKEANYWKQAATKQQEKLQKLETQIEAKKGIEKKQQNFIDRLFGIIPFLLFVVTFICIFSVGQNQQLEQKDLEISELEQNNNELEGKLDRLETAIEQEFDGKFGRVENGRGLIVYNQCSDEPIRIALKYKHPSGIWKTEGWWIRDSSEKSYLKDSDGESIRLGSPLLYYYAELEADSSINWSGEESVDVDGILVNERSFFYWTNLPMRSRVLFPNSDDDYAISFTCNN